VGEDRLDRDLAAKDAVTRLVDHSHPSFTDLGADDVLAELAIAF
jgi:hypothetical protein